MFCGASTTFQVTRHYNESKTAIRQWEFALMSLENTTAILVTMFGGFLATIFGMLSQLFFSRRDERRITIKFHKQRQAEKLDELLCILTEVRCYLRYKLALLSPAEHYVFSLVYKPDKKQHLGYYHMMIEKSLITMRPYLPQKITESLEDLSLYLSSVKQIEFNGISENQKNSSYTATDDRVIQNIKMIENFISTSSGI